MSEHLGIFSWFLVVLSIVFCATFTIWEPLTPFEHDWALKASGIWILSFISFSYVGMKRGSLLLCLALIFSGIGDVCLEVSESTATDVDEYFLLGMAAFALAHAMYIPLFWPHVSTPTSFAHFLVLLLSVGYAVVVGASCIPFLSGSALLYPVLAYMSIIVVMVALAVLSVGGLGSWWVCLGALFFAVSDSLIAMQMFMRVPIENGGQWVMATYYIGQQLITVGYLTALGPAADAKKKDL